MNFGTITEAPALNDLVQFNPVSKKQQPVFGQVVELELHNNLLKIKDVAGNEHICGTEEGSFDILIEFANSSDLTMEDIVNTVDAHGGTELTSFFKTIESELPTQPLETETSKPETKVVRLETDKSRDKPVSYAEGAWHTIKTETDMRDAFLALVQGNENFVKGKPNKHWGADSKIKELYGHFQKPTYIEHEDALVIIRRFDGGEGLKPGFLILDICNDMLCYTLPSSISCIVESLDEEARLNYLLKAIANLK